MAKRFTDTNKYKKPFIRSLQGAYKLLWDYLYHECDHAGIWIVDFEIAQIHLGSDSKINKSDALKYFNEGEIRVFEIDKNRWFLPGFIDFQYGELNPENRAHNSVIKVLKSFNLIDSDFNIKPLTSPLQGAKDKDKDKENLKKGVVGEKNFEPLHGKFIEAWKLWISCRSKKFKNESSEAIGRKKFFELCRGDENLAFPIVEQSIANGWAGLFEVKNNSPGKLEIQVKSKQEQQSDRIKNVAQNLIKSLKDNQNADIRPMEIAQVHG